MTYPRGSRGDRDRAANRDYRRDSSSRRFDNPSSSRYSSERYSDRYDRPERSERMRSYEASERGYEGYREPSTYRPYSESRESHDRDMQLNRYPHSYSEYESRGDLEDRRFGATEGDSYLYDRSHEPSSSWDRGGSRSGRSERSEGRYAGRGPKGYKRTDERIREDVCDMLTRDASIDASDIEVDVRDGEVTLSGTVIDRRMKYLAEECAERCSGVRDVTNHLRIRKEATTTNSASATTDMSASSSSQSLTGDRTVTGKKGPSSSTSTSSSH